MEPFSLDEVALQDYQPNRYPFLMIDRVTEVLPGKYAKGFKNLTLNEWYFPKHFPGAPNMPGALQLESMAQMLTVAITTLPEMKGKVTHASSHTVLFKREVKPGDRLDLIAEVVSWNRGVCIGKGQGLVDGEIACEAKMVIVIPDILDMYKPKREN
jgi:3-hydroxyacyl-[acyl-carrier-protein] dehydratase